MFKTLEKVIVLAVALFVVFASQIMFSFADDIGYTTDRYDVNVDVSKNHVCHVTETISVNFKNAKHGLYRYIPYDVNNYRIKNISVEGYEYSLEGVLGKSTMETIIKIGSEDKLLTGKNIYQIKYDVVCYEDSDESQDYFSLDLLPTNWETSIDSTKITLTMPEKFDFEKASFYAETYGNTGIDENITYVYDESSRMVTITGKNIVQGVGVTMDVNLPNGYWKNAANYNFLKFPLTIFLFVIPLIAVALWFIFGRNRKIIETVEFYPPEKMTPAEIGYIIDGVIDERDLTSMIMYYASKGYLSIDEYEKDKFLLTKLKGIDSDEKKFSRTFFNGIFENGDEVKMDEMPEEFGDFFLAAKSELKGYYRNDKKIMTSASAICRVIACILMPLPSVVSIVAGSFICLRFFNMIAAIPVLILLVCGIIFLMISFDKRNSNGRKTGIALFVTGTIFMISGMAITIMVTILLLDFGFALITTISTLVICLAAMFMRSRTDIGAKWQGEILGFRTFIKTAELDRLKLLSNENPEYFYDVMPYAYVMGLSNMWAKRFENIPTDAPRWYAGYNGNMLFNVIWFNHMMNSCNRTFATNAFKISGMDTGRGGSFGGGGGFSGGGFGGGGGGAW